ncbi:MAG: SpoIIIAC/SpoIIIAD family protein [Lachnospiraceae bacterium]|nr:SpoIIIAC/SpoIIIAD family protein [Lachnospiraceae bacterium]
MEIIRIAILGIAGFLLAVMVRDVRPEYAVYISLGTVLCIMLLSVERLKYLLEMLRDLESYLPIDTAYLHSLLKMIGITYVGQFSAGLCKDAGYSAIAGQIEIFSRLSVLVLSMPILLALMETIRSFLS